MLAYRVGTVSAVVWCAATSRVECSVQLPADASTIRTQHLELSERTELWGIQVTVLVPPPVVDCCLCKPNLFIYQARECSLVQAGCLTAKFLQKT